MPRETVDAAIHCSLATLLLVVLGTLAACGGGGGASAPPQPPASPTPAITSLSPSSVVEGSAAQTLTIAGTGFESGSTVTFNGVAHAATFVSATSLTIELTAADQATPGSYPVVVTSPSPGGGASAAVNFTVTLPPPTIASLSPSAVLAGAAAQTLTVTGTGFQNGATVTFNGSAHAATVVSATSITIQLTAADQATGGTYPVVVKNTDGQTATADFTVTNPVPTVTALSPSVYPCDAAPVVTITGTGFLPVSTVTYNGGSLAATYVSATQLTIPLTKADIQTAGSYAVVVTNAGPGGGSATGTYTVQTPSGQPLSGSGAESATVTVNAVNADGSTGTLLCSESTDAGGNFSLTLDTQTAGAMRVSTTGGQITYVGAGGATTFAESGAQTALLDSVPAGGDTGLAVGFTSSLVDSLAQGLITFGKQATVAAAHASATTTVDGLLGFSGASAIEQIAANSQDGANRLAFESGVLAEGLSLDKNAPTAIETALVSDFSDGVFDGRASGTAVAFASGNLPTTAGSSDALDAAIGWVNSYGSANLPAGTTSPVAALVKGMANCACTPPAIGLLQTNSGRLAALAFNGHQYLFIAEGEKNDGLMVVDVTDPTAANFPDNNWTTLTANGAPILGLAAVLGNSDHPELFAYTGGTSVAMLNAATLVNGTPGTDNPIEFQGSLAINGEALVSGTNMNITSAAWDGCNDGCRVLLATGDGYTNFNPANDLLDESQLYTVQDANEKIAENFGELLAPGINVTGSAGRDPILFAGNGGGIQLVDLAGKTSYYMSLGAGLGYFPNFPGGIGTSEFVDASALDLGDQTAVLVPEGGTYIGLMGLDGLTETVGGGGALNSFTPGTGGGVQIDLGAGLNVEGAAVDSTNHLALIMPAMGNQYVTVGKIQTPTAMGWQGLSDWTFYNLAGSKYASAFSVSDNPHSAISFASLGGGNAKTAGISYGYMSDASGTGLLQVDMSAFLNMARAGGSGDAAHTAASDPTQATDATTGGWVIEDLNW